MGRKISQHECEWCKALQLGRCPRHTPGRNDPPPEAGVVHKRVDLNWQVRDPHGPFARAATEQEARELALEHKRKFGVRVWIVEIKVSKPLGGAPQSDWLHGSYRNQGLAQGGARSHKRSFTRHPVRMTATSKRG